MALDRLVQGLRNHRPLNCGARFSTKEARPSFASSVNASVMICVSRKLIDRQPFAAAIKDGVTKVRISGRQIVELSPRADEVLNAVED